MHSRLRHFHLVTLGCLLLVAPSAVAQDTVPGLTESALGVTRSGTPIRCLFSPESLQLDTSKLRILLIGGLDGSRTASDSVVSMLRWFQTDAAAEKLRARCDVSAVPWANPDGLEAGTSANRSGGEPMRGYPPQGESYSSPTNPEAAYLWRWIGMHAPDLVVEVRGGGAKGTAKWAAPVTNRDPLAYLASALKVDWLNSGDDELVPQLAHVAPCNVGTIPALRLTVGDTSNPLPALFAAIEKSKFTGPSPARRELQRRLARSPRQVSEELAKHYGHDLPSVQYIPAVALIGRIRLGKLTGTKELLADVERIVSSFASGQKPTLGTKASGSDLAGHLVFGELAQATGNARYVELLQVAADRGFDASGHPLPVMPYHNEMSDAVFMGGPILAQAGRLTGEEKYFDMCLRNMRYMLKLNVRADGLHRHSPLDETAWGRGNGFPALGLTWSLDEFPAEHPGRAELARNLKAHLDALLPHQDPTGCWHQVVDRPESYRELSCTSMICYALARGMRKGWLERDRYEPAMQKAWYAIRTRVGSDGGLVDVCTGTGKQRSLRDYYDRGAILGRDPRGGAMALLAATEIMALYPETSNGK